MPRLPKADELARNSSQRINQSDSPTTYDGLKLYKKAIPRIPKLTPEEETELAKRAKAGDKAAFEKMVHANLFFVIAEAHRFEGLGVPVSDLISEGNIGLMKGVERFDPTKGRLLTWVSFYVKREIKRALANQGRDVRVPVCTAQNARKVEKTANSLTKSLQREPTIAEISVAAKLPILTVKHTTDRLDRGTTTFIPLDVPIKYEGGETFESSYPDPNIRQPDEDASINYNIQKVIRLLEEETSILEPRLKNILKLRFGLNSDRKEHSLEEVASIYNCSRERIRQLQNRALLIIRSYLDDELEQKQPL